MGVGTEERKAAIEIIATLVHLKNRMAELILQPAGIPPEIYHPLLKRRNPVTGREISKREIGQLCLDAMEQRPDGSKVVREVLKIAANWTEERYYLADKEEYTARAAVQKARVLLRTIQHTDEEEAGQSEKRKQEEQARIEQERAKQSALLCMMFDDLVRAEDAQRRGFQLQELLKLTFDAEPFLGLPQYLKARGNK